MLGTHRAIVGVRLVTLALHACIVDAAAEVVDLAVVAGGGEAHVAVAQRATDAVAVEGAGELRSLHVQLQRLVIRVAPQIGRHDPLVCRNRIKRQRREQQRRHFPGHGHGVRHHEGPGGRMPQPSRSLPHAHSVEGNPGAARRVACACRLCSGDQPPFAQLREQREERIVAGLVVQEAQPSAPGHVGDHLQRAPQVGIGMPQ